MSILFTFLFLQSPQIQSANDEAFLGKMPSGSKWSNGTWVRRLNHEKLTHMQHIAQRWIILLKLNVLVLRQTKHASTLCWSDVWRAYPWENPSTVPICKYNRAGVYCENISLEHMLYMYMMQWKQIQTYTHNHTKNVYLCIHLFYLHNYECAAKQTSYCFQVKPN